MRLHFVVQCANQMHLVLSKENILAPACMPQDIPALVARELESALLFCLT